MNYLAADAREGRFTGSPGIAQAASYLERELRRLGFSPLGTLADLRHPFGYTAEVQIVWDSTQFAFLPPGGEAVALRDGGFLPLGFSGSGGAQAEIVFAGYGIRVPAGPDGKSAYDSYAGLDVKDKIVLIQRHVPTGLTAIQRQELGRYADLRFKVAQAQQQGARAVLILSEEALTHASAGLRGERSGAAAGLPVVQLSQDLLLEQLADTARWRRTLAQLDTAQRGGLGYALGGLQAQLAVRLRPRRASDVNVVAVLPPPAGQPESYVMIGAHYDHLGYGQTGSLARTDAERAAIHNGADDNASGVACVLELARVLARQTGRTRGLIVAFWSGEELGLIGSTQFAERPPVPLSTLAAYVNYDMVGRLRQGQLMVQGLGSSAQWRPLAEAALATDTTLRPQFVNDPYLPTDVTAFYPRGVPVLAFFTGSHDDYHRPTDDAPTLNLPGIARVAAVSATTLWPLLSGQISPVHQRVEQAASARGGVMGTRVSVGTIPDYSYETGDGMKLAGVRGGSAADKAGLKSGDVLIEFAGQKVGSVQDYMVALSGCKPGAPVKAVVRREGQRVELSVTPDAAVAR